MLDIIGAILFGVILAADAAILIGLARIQTSAKLKAFAVAGGWTTMMIVVASLGGFAPGSIGNFPAPVVAFTVLIAAGLLGWFHLRSFRDAFLSLPAAALIGVNGFRLFGIFFILLDQQDRLSAPFGPIAGWGDIITGLAAIGLSGLLLSGRNVSARLLSLWNAFGALDLIAAVSLASLSATGTPFQLFMDPRGTDVMTTLPWIFAATILVPVYLFTHLALAVQLREAGARELRVSEVLV